MNRAVDGNMEALGLEGHEALIVAHDDTRHSHVHAIANGVDPETGKAATLATASSSCRAGPGAPNGNRAGSGAKSGSRTTQRPRDRAQGEGDLPKGSAGRGEARTADRHRAGVAGGQRARTERNPCFYPAAPAPRPRAWRRRVRALILMSASHPESRPVPGRCTATRIMSYSRHSRSTPNDERVS